MEKKRAIMTRVVEKAARELERQAKQEHRSLSAHCAMILENEVVPNKAAKDS